MAYFQLDGTLVQKTAEIIMNKHKIIVDTHIGKMMFSMSELQETLCSFIWRKSCYDTLGNKLYPTLKEALRRKKIEKNTRDRKARATTKPKKRKRAKPQYTPPAKKHKPKPMRTYTSIWSLMSDLNGKNVSSEQVVKYLQQAPDLLSGISSRVRADINVWLGAHGCVFNA
jgi:hypothetical protein